MVSYGRARYAEVLDTVTQEREDGVKTRAGQVPVVMNSVGKSEASSETAYVMRPPANARRLLDAMERLESGAGEEHALVADD